MLTGDKQINNIHEEESQFQLARSSTTERHAVIAKNHSKIDQSAVEP